MYIDYMGEALKEAQKAYKMGEVPVGAVIVKNDRIIAKAHNIKENKQSVTRHAEIIAIERASKKLSNWRLEDCDIYVTLKPCAMCASAIQQARIKTVYYGVKANDENRNKIVDLIFSTTDINKSTIVVEKNNNKCSELLKNFFQEQRFSK